MLTKQQVEAATDRALKFPRPGFETAFSRMLAGVAEYIATHANRYESSISDDGVLGPAVAGLIANLLALLDGETGRLDCGVLWGKLDALAVAGGWKDLDACREDARF